MAQLISSDLATKIETAELEIRAAELRLLNAYKSSTFVCSFEKLEDVII